MTPPPINSPLGKQAAAAPGASCARLGLLVQARRRVTSRSPGVLNPGRLVPAALACPPAACVRGAESQRGVSLPRLLRAGRPPGFLGRPLGLRGNRFSWREGVTAWIISKTYLSTSCKFVPLSNIFPILPLRPTPGNHHFTLFL